MGRTIGGDCGYGPGSTVLGEDRGLFWRTASLEILTLATAALAPSLAGSAEDLGSVQAGDAGDRGDHHTGKQLHGGHVALVEGSGRGRQDFEDTESAAVVAKGRDQDRADSKAAAAGEVNARVVFGIMAKHDFAGTDSFGRDSGIGLQPDAKVGSGASGAGAADDLIASAKRDGRSGGSGKVLSALRNGADRRFEIEFTDVDFDFFRNLHSTEPHGWVSGIRDAELIALRERGNAGLVGGVERRWRRNGAEQIANQVVEFNIGDQVCSLLIAKRSTEHARETDQGVAATGKAVGLVACADQLTLHAKCGRLQWDKGNVSEGAAINSIAKHDVGSSFANGENLKLTR